MYSHHFLILSIMLRSWKKLPVGALRSREQTHLPRVTSLHFIRWMEQREKWASTPASRKHAWALAPLCLTHQNRNQAEPAPTASGEIIKGNPILAERSPHGSIPSLIMQVPSDSLWGIEVSRYGVGTSVSTLLFPPVEWVSKCFPLAILFE